MIRVTVELIPGGIGMPEHLGTAVIANDGTGNEDLAHYDVRLSKRGQPGVTWRRGRIEGFPRKRLGAWDLLYRAMKATVGTRG